MHNKYLLNLLKEELLLMGWGDLAKITARFGKNNRNGNRTFQAINSS